MNHTEMAQGETNVPIQMIPQAESSVPEFRQKGQLEKEDIVILFLSGILIVATLWLASAVL